MGIPQKADQRAHKKRVSLVLLLADIGNKVEQQRSPGGDRKTSRRGPSKLEAGSVFDLASKKHPKNENQGELVYLA